MSAVTLHYLPRLVLTFLSSFFLFKTCLIKTILSCYNGLFDVYLKLNLYEIISKERVNNAVSDLWENDIMTAENK